MKRSILTITTIIALAIPAAVSAATITDSFERDLNRNNTQITTETRTGQDSVQQHVNRTINGSDTLIASFDRDLYRTATPTAPVTGNADSIQQVFNVALASGNSNALVASFDRDLYRTATPAAPTTRNADSIQQVFNVALAGGNSNALVASFDHDLYRTATPAAPVTGNADSIQQVFNVALSGGNNNALIASFERAVGAELVSVINSQITFQLNPALITAFA